MGSEIYRIYKGLKILYKYTGSLNMGGGVRMVELSDCNYYPQPYVSMDTDYYMSLKDKYKLSELGWTFHNTCNEWRFKD